MGGLYILEEISRVRSIGCYDVVESDSFFSLLYNPLAPMDGIFSHLLALTSYITHRFFTFIEDLVLQDVYRYSQDFAVSSCQDQDSATEYGIHVQETPDLNDSWPVYSISTIVEKKCNCWGIHFILKGLVLPLCCVRSAWNLASACFRFCFSYVRCARTELMSILFRVRKTLRGSSDDIGWMQNAPGLDPVEDGSARFLELLQATRNGEHKLPDSYVYLLIPGLFSNHGPLYFVSTKKFFSKMGLACHIAKIHSEASVEHNSWVLKQYIEELYWGSGKRVMLLGHSKGGVDAAAALSLYWADLKDKVAGLALVQSPYGGTPIASDILREGQIADKETRRIMELVICKLIKGDIRALEDLTYEKRKEFIAKHKFPKDIPLISFHSEASIGPGVISTLTHIAHAELPWFPFHKFGFKEKDDEVHKVPVVAPVSAALAISALHLQLRYGEKSDGLVTCRDAEAPGSVVVRPDRKLDHSWMVYSSWRKDPTEPDACEMCEALLTMLVELGKTKHNVSLG